MKYAFRRVKELLYEIHFADEKLFLDFNEKQREHLINVSKKLDEVQKDIMGDILEEFFTPLGKDETIDEREKSLEIAVEKIMNSASNSIESINRQIGYCMVLYSYI